MSALSPRQMFLLDEACKPIAEGFDSNPYLVGTAGERGAYRDVDVRLILDDEKYALLHSVSGIDLIALLGLVIGNHLAGATGLPVDFQIQQQSAANAQHPDKSRNPLGLRSLQNYRGDTNPILD